MKILSDGWTAVTRDRSLSAQFEHTVGVTETGCQVFTLSPQGWTGRQRHSAIERQLNGLLQRTAASPTISAIASG